MAISSHKIIVIILVVFWAIYNFTATNEESLYYDNGQIKRSGQLENSLNEGLWNWYYENGQIQHEGDYIDGKKDAKWTWWDENGQMVADIEAGLPMETPLWITKRAKALGRDDTEWLKMRD